MKQINTTYILFETHLAELGLYFIREYQFHTQRKWRADYFVCDDEDFLKGHPTVYADTLIEIEGGIGYFQNPKGQVIRGGRHTRQKGYQADLDKYNHAVAMGFKVFRFSTTDVLRGRAKAFLAEWMKKS